MLATIELGHRGDMGKMQQVISESALWQAVVALRLAVLFCRSRIAIQLPEQLDLKLEAKGFVLTVSQNWLKDNPLTASAFRQEVLQWKNVGFQLDFSQI